MQSYIIFNIEINEKLNKKNLFENIVKLYLNSFIKK